ncbi:hypothetical protein HDV06_006228 [Boothiomyces sp. JEL0866]|nr:hypothetical protein HDV06_006228 [Boothiomyces sp. JEL0866]
MESTPPTSPKTPSKRVPPGGHSQIAFGDYNLPVTPKSSIKLYNNNKESPSHASISSLHLDHQEHKSSESPEPLNKIQKKLPREQQSSIVFGDDGDAEEKKKQFGKRRVANPPGGQSSVFFG